LLPGSQLNAGGRSAGSINEFRRRFEPHMPEIVEVLLELLRSKNESVRLSAVHEILDRVLGKAAVFVDATNTRVDVGQLYLAALRRANSEVETINGGIGSGASEPK
jgi:hypothetical protein